MVPKKIFFFVGKFKTIEVWKLFFLLGSSKPSKFGNYFFYKKFQNLDGFKVLRKKKIFLDIKFCILFNSKKVLYNIDHFSKMAQDVGQKRIKLLKKRKRVDATPLIQRTKKVHCMFLISSVLQEITYDNHLSVDCEQDRQQLLRFTPTSFN